MGDIGSGMWPKPSPWDIPASPLKPYSPYAPIPDEPIKPYSPQLIPSVVVPQVQILNQGFPTKAQFEAFLKLLRAAIEFDAATGQKECETAAKTAWIKTMCDHFGLESPLK